MIKTKDNRSVVFEALQGEGEGLVKVHQRVLGKTGN